MRDDRWTVGRGFAALLDWFSAIFRRTVVGGSFAPRPASASSAGPANTGDLFGARLDDKAQPTVGDSHAPWMQNDVGVGVFKITDDPRILQMRRAAVLDIFDQAGLDIVPAQFWSFLKAHRDPYEAVIVFLKAIGIEPALIQRGDADEVERANEVLDLLVRIEGSFDRLSPEGKTEVEAAIFSGIYDRVREAAEITAIYGSIEAKAVRWPRDRRFAAFNDFLSTIMAEVADPMRAAMDDARTAQHLSDRMIGLMETFDALAADYARIDEEMERGGWASWAEAGEVGLQRGRFVAGMAEAFDRNLPLDDLDAIVDAVLHTAVAELDRLAKHHRPSAGGRTGSRRGSTKSGASGGRAGGSAGRSSGHPPAVVAALVYFGFSTHATPTAIELKSAWKAKIKLLHPDTGGSDEAAKECNLHYDQLRSIFKG